MRDKSILSIVTFLNVSRTLRTESRPFKIGLPAIDLDINKSRRHYETVLRVSDPHFFFGGSGSGQKL